MASSPASSPSDAAQKLFNTTELLESILLEVDDVGTLLLSQRVDRNFKAVIGGSSRLQRALFFQQVPAHKRQHSAFQEQDDLIERSKSRTLDTGPKKASCSSVLVMRKLEKVAIAKYKEIAADLLKHNRGSSALFRSVCDAESKSERER